MQVLGQKLMIDTTSFVGIDTTVIDENIIYCYTEYNLEEKYNSTKCFYENGSIAIIEANFKGELFGTKIIFYTNGNLKEIRQYDKGQPVGVWYSYYEDGKIKERAYFGDYVEPIEFEEDSIGSTVKLDEFTSNQTIWKKTKFYNGEVKKWFINGRLKSKEYYIKGKENGTFKYYDSNGVLLKKIKHKNGKKLN